MSDEVVDLLRKNKYGHPLCTTIKADGTPCKAIVLEGYTTCRFHTLGHDLAFKPNPEKALDPRYAKYIPKSLKKIYDDGVSDPDLLSLQAEIHLIDARTNELLASINALPPSEVFQKLYNLIGSLRAALRGNENPKVVQLLDEMSNIVTEQVSGAEVWSQVTPLIKVRQSLTESEINRMVKLKQFIPVEKASLMVAALSASVKKHVPDPLVRESIAEEFGRIARGYVSPFAGQPVEVSGG